MTLQEIVKQKSELKCYCICYIDMLAFFSAFCCVIAIPCDSMLSSLSICQAYHVIPCDLPFHSMSEVGNRNAGTKALVEKV